MRKRAARLTAAVVLAAAAMGHAADGPMCVDPQPKDVFAKLRQLSLDLRGRVPSYDEYAAVEGMTEVPASIVDAYLASPELGQVLREYHEALLWPNVSNLAVTNAAFNIRSERATNLWFGAVRSQRYRGVQGVGCLDKPATFDASGAIVTERSEITPGRFVDREGYVMVSPYWAPATPIKVCAFDAQANATATGPTGAMVRCDSAAGGNVKACGCGPEMRWCQSVELGMNTHLAITQSWNEQIRRLVDATVGKAGRPYQDLMLERTVDVNGPIVHFLKHQSVTSSPNRLWLYADSDWAPLPDLKFTDTTTWVPVERGPKHAGVLTAPGYTIRFQSDRGRANRFHVSFLCAPFSPPPGGLPPGDDPCTAEPDLTKRCGCQYCHAGLEPTAAYWGRFAEQGTTFLDPATYSTFRQSCADCARRFAGAGGVCGDPLCKFYVTEGQTAEEKAAWGTLRSYQFRTPQQIASIEAGPRALVEATVADGRLADCVSRTAFEWLVRREASADETRSLLPALSMTFAGTGHDFRALVKEIVTSPIYGRVR